MFQSYKAIKYIDKKCLRWEYEITDSEFGTVSGVCADLREAVIQEYSKRNLNVVSELEIWSGVIIQEYNKRNLNVAVNLAVAFNWYNKKYPYWTIQKLIDYNKNYNPLFPPYEEDLQKYLVLL
jgi:hypothetical protein